LIVWLFYKGIKVPFESPRSITIDAEIWSFLFSMVEFKTFLIFSGWIANEEKPL